MYYVLSKEQPNGLLEFEEFSDLEQAKMDLYNKRQLRCDVLMVEKSELPLLELIGERLW